jgi:hypothetical protein
VPGTRLGVTHDTHDNIPASAQILEPSGEQPCISEAYTAANLIRVSQDVAKSLTEFREQVGMTLSDVSLAFVGQFHGAMQIRALEMSHFHSLHTPKFHATKRTQMGEPFGLWETETLL